jgi:hypothetical protein
MHSLKTRILVGICVADFLLAGWAQSPRELHNRIPRPDETEYRAVQDARRWRNPYLIVRADGIEIVGMPPVGKAVPVGRVPGILERLPDSAWPYGLIVAVQEAGVRTDRQRPYIEANRRKLLRLLKELGITINQWPSA